MGKKAKVIGAAAGVAAAATAAVVVTRKGAAKKITDKVTETVKAAKKRAAAAKKKAIEQRKAAVQRTKAEPKKAVAEPSMVIYHVMKSGDQWSVQADGAARASSLHPNKKEALAAARVLAASKAPSQLVIHRVDGSVQDTRTYEPE